MHISGSAPYLSIQRTQPIHVDASLHPVPFAEILLISCIESFCIRLLLLIVMMDQRQIHYKCVIIMFAAGPVSDKCPRVIVSAFSYTLKSV